MTALIRFLTSMFKTADRSPGSQHVSGNSPLGGAYQSDSTLSDLAARLEEAGRLLIVPNPASINTVSCILSDVQTKLQQLTPEVVKDVPLQELRGFEVLMKRTRSLMEGAQRVQWTHLR